MGATIGLIAYSKSQTMVTVTAKASRARQSHQGRPHTTARCVPDRPRV